MNPDSPRFENQLLELFFKDATENDFFKKNSDEEWMDWIALNLKNNAVGLMEPLLKGKQYMLPHIINSWEKAVGIPKLVYR